MAKRRFKLTELVLPERIEQKHLFAWADNPLVRKQYPELAMLFAVPNGGYQLHPASAAKLKAEGLRSGVPDICLAVRRGGYGALFIELKSRRVGATLSPDQMQWLARLNEYGYNALVCVGATTAQRVIEDYLKLPRASSRVTSE